MVVSSFDTTWYALPTYCLLLAGWEMVVDVSLVCGSGPFRIAVKGQGDTIAPPGGLKQRR